MSSYRPDIREYLFDGTEQPQPDWERVGEWIQIYVPPDDRSDVWTEFALQWLSLISTDCFGAEYEIIESENFLLFASPPRISLQPTVRFAEFCRTEILSRLPGLAKFDQPGKYPVLIFSGSDAYYGHLLDYYPDGDHGGSSGVHVRTRYPHIAVLDGRPEVVPRTIAHEMTHAGLQHLQMPLWLEEGLTQLFEHDLAGQNFALDYKEVREQKDYRRENGLDEFWSGTGFSSAGDVQKYSYQLAEILIRILLADYQARWFGFDRRPVEKLVGFLSAANADDHGASAAELHLGLSLEQIAEKSLGPSDWKPRGYQ